MADIWTQLNELAVCLCAELSENDMQTLCFCGVMAGDSPYDFAGIGDCGEQSCGQAWVRLVNTYPSTALGVADSTAQNCTMGLGFDVEVGILRCWPIEEDGEAITPTQMQEVAEQQLLDMAAMRRAIVCCDAIDQHILGMWNPVGPEGILIGGTWTLYLGE